MRILILGAGKVGASVAGNLVSESNDITIVDKDKNKINEIQGMYDLQGIVGDATSPSVLADAGAADADMLVAVTASDETNLATTLIAEQLFNIPARIARVRNEELREYPALLSTSGFRATSVIWPEEAVTNSIVQLIHYPEALQVIDFSTADLILVSVKTDAGSKMAGKTVADIHQVLPDAKVQIVSISRQKFSVTNIRPDTVINPGDEVFFLPLKSEASNIIRVFRQKVRRYDRIMIAGGGSLSLQLARALDSSETANGDNYNIKILEGDPSRCQYLSEHLSSSVLVLNGDMTDESLFINEGIANIDVFIAVSNDDEDNFMSCLLAKRLGAHCTIALINRSSYIDLIDSTDIDIAFSPTESVLSDLLRHIRQGDVVSAHTLRRGAAEAMEIVAHGTPKNSKVIGCIVRKEDDSQEVLMASEKDLSIEDDDHVIIFADSRQQVPEIEKLFAPSVGFF